MDLQYVLTWDWIAVSLNRGSSLIYVHYGLPNWNVFDMEDYQIILKSENKIEYKAKLNRNAKT